MKKYAPLTALAALVMTGLLLHFSGVATAGPQGSGGGARPFCGTFYSEYAFDGIPLNAMTHLNSDGTAVLTDMFHFGLGGAFDKSMPAFGDWWHSGPREVTQIDLRFGFTQEGLPVRVYRTTTIATFDPGFDRATGAGSVRVYELALGEDPLDPDQGTDFGDPFTFVLRRVNQ